MDIGNRYQIEKELGAGGMGTVYLGLDKQTGTKVAIKQLKSELAQADLLERFKREGQALRELNHPNIVKLLDALEDNGRHYLIMDYVAGGDLRQVLEKGKVSYQDCLKMAIDLADALTRAHKLNIIHRDLKPANILIAEDGTLLLTDFGVAHVRNKERVTQTDAIIGTLDYLPPEGLTGEAIDARADIWSFGVMLFEMLAGQRPFSGTNYIQTLLAIATAPIPDLEALAPHVPIALIDLVYRMLVRDPQARISSVRHVGAALEDILQERENLSRFETPLPDFRERPKHNLPAQTSVFVGREAELAELARLLENPNQRLISIVAQGGMGKTRLSLEAAERQLPNFEQGVYFVELAPLTESASILTAIANALNYAFQNDGRSPQDQLNEFLQPKNVLLILDNFEHLLDGASIVTELLQAAPKLKILITSRQRLDQIGESLFHLSGMDFSTWETPQDALNYAAVKLFIHSATRAKPDFQLTADNLDDVARICFLVQGMPLGIVLAAAWLGMLSPKEVSAELQQGLDFLESDSQQIPERQRSIRAVMSYSWHSMSAPEQAAFAQLAVFRGGFTREAAEAVAGGNLRLLMSLVTKSLLRRDTETGRYEIHELLRQYAEEKCQEMALLDSVHANHARYFANWLLAQDKALKSSPQLETVTLIEADYMNIQAAWYWHLQANKVEIIQSMMRVMTVFFMVNEDANEAIHFFMNSSKNVGASFFKKRLELRAAFFMFRNNFALAPNLRLDFTNSPEDDLFEQAFSKHIQALHLWNIRQNYDAALALISEIFALFEQLGEKWWLAQTYHLQRDIYSMRILSLQRLESLQTAYHLFIELGADLSALRIKSKLADIAFSSGDFETALAWIHTVNAERRKLPKVGLGLMDSLNSEAIFLEYLGAYEESIALQKEILALAQHHNSIGFQQRASLSIAGILGVLRRPEAEIETWLAQADEFNRLYYNDQISLAMVEGFRAYVAYHSLDYERARSYFLQAFERVKSEIRLSSFYLMMLGLCEVKLQNFAEARRYFLSIIGEGISYINQLIILYGYAELAYTEKDYQWSAELASALYAAKAMTEPYKSYTKDLLDLLQTVLSEEEYQAALERGKHLDLAQVIQRFSLK